MNGQRITVPDIVRAKAAVGGDQGQGWVDLLPQVVAQLQDRWSIHVEQQLEGGTSGFVARARTASGARVVVKVAVPEPDFARQVRTLELAGGRGFVRLLGHEPDHHAVLLEHLGPPLHRVRLRPERQLSTLAAVLAQVWSLPRTDTEGADGWLGEPVDKAAGLHDLVVRHLQQLEDVCAPRVLARALQFAEQRSAAFDPDRAVVVHGDAAAPNLLQVPVPRPGGESGFVFVDPSTFLGDPAYDLGVALRDWCPELLAGDAPTLARRWCRLLAAAGRQDETAVWQWGYLERVSTGLYAMSLTGGAEGRQHLRTAEVLCDVGPDQ